MKSRNVVLRASGAAMDVLFESGSSRRGFIKQLATAAGLMAAPAFIRTVYGAWPDNPGSSLFTLGVASGDPQADSVVIWTRLAPDPLNGGGMENQNVGVSWQVATDPAMSNVVRQGVAT